jgi:hypothetical protein
MQNLKTITPLCKGNGSVSILKTNLTRRANIKTNKLLANYYPVFSTKILFSAEKRKCWHCYPFILKMRSISCHFSSAVAVSLVF